MSTMTLHKGPRDNDGRKIIINTYGLKPRDQAIRFKIFRTLRHQQRGQSADGERTYFGIWSAENERFSHKCSAYCEGVIVSYVLQHQEIVIQARTCSTFRVHVSTIVSLSA
jgi:hypothetical protein